MKPTKNELHNFGKAEAAAGQGHWGEANYYLQCNLFNRLFEIDKRLQKIIDSKK
jgi:hypothetical protein